MTTFDALSVFFAAVVIGFLTACIVGAVTEARRPQPEAPVKRPCECAHCVGGMDIAEEFHIRLWEQEIRA
jgi:hypothetical protein